MLHGLWRSIRAMQPLSNHLNDGGYTTVNVPYASFRYELKDLVKHVMHQIQPWLDSGKRVHFVTHSLGGVVLKKLIESMDKHDLGQIGRVVMLAPPHQGSEIMDWLKTSPVRLFRGVLGPASDFLSTESMSRECGELRSGVDAVVIMGEKCALPFFKTLLEEPNDGIISVNKGQLSGVKHFKIVDSDHTFIASNVEVMEMTRGYIENGEL